MYLSHFTWGCIREFISFCLLMYRWPFLLRIMEITKYKYVWTRVCLIDYLPLGSLMLACRWFSMPANISASGIKSKLQCCWKPSSRRSHLLVPTQFEFPLKFTFRTHFLTQNRFPTLYSLLKEFSSTPYASTVQSQNSLNPTPTKTFSVEGKNKLDYI